MLNTLSINRFYPAKSIRQQIKACRKAMLAADSYQQWQQGAEELDYLQNKHIWRDQDQSRFYDATMIQAQIQRIRQFRKAGDTENLVTFLSESVYHNQGDLTEPELFHMALSGTKKIVSDYFFEVEKALCFLAEQDDPRYSLNIKIKLFKQAARTYGRSALMLSGGSTLGLFHIGVVKALWEQRLLPDIITGSSMGAIIAAGICTRTDHELDEFFSDSNRIYRHAFRLFALGNMIKHKCLMDASALLANIDHNTKGNFTFEQAFARTGRILNISVSPTRSRQKPRLLSYLTSPNVMINTSALASCAVPGLFPPRALESKNHLGRKEPYMPMDQWIDGSIFGDLPKMRLSRLHNVNHFIVSQTNPHTLPFISIHQSNHFALTATDYMLSSLRAQWVNTIDVLRKKTIKGHFRHFLDKVFELSDQTYLGDINIQPGFDPWLYRKVLKNPTSKDLNLFIRNGERATWPKIAMIKEHTRISRAFAKCIDLLTQKQSEMHFTGLAN